MHLPISLWLLWPALITAQQSKQTYPSLADTVLMASVDCRKLPETEARQVRYLSYAHLPSQRHGDFYKVLSFHCCCLSISPDLPLPRILAGQPTGIVAIALDDYGWTPQLWDRLAQADPYYHVTIEEQVTETEGEGTRTEKITSKTVRRPSLAPWLTPTREHERALTELATITRSQAPILRADWFLWQTGAQAERNPGYYDFLGIKDRKSFHELIGLDEKILERYPKKLREAVSDSGVSQQPRRIDRLATVGGALWFTSDVDAAEGKKNPLRLLESEFEPDAHEEFAHLPNGLWTFGLFAATGARQASAPDFVGFDATSHNNDGRIHVGISCIRCHGVNGGINDIDGWARGLFGDKLELKSPDRATAQRLRRLYVEPLTDAIEDDRRVYARAVKRLNGWAPERNAKAYGEAWAEYDSGVDAQRAARECGVSVVDLRAALDKAIKAEGAITDLPLTALLIDKTIPLRAWAESHQTMQTILRKTK